MAEYDGSIRIGTEIDTKGFKDGEKEIESESRRVAESVSKTAQKDAQQIEKELENLKYAQKSFLEAGGAKTAPVYQGYEKEIQSLQSALDSLQRKQEENNIADEHWNLLRIDVEEYAKALKELQSQGKFFGDEDYDKVYLAWKNATDAVKAYQAELNKQTESGQAKIAEQEAKAAERKEAAQRKAEEQAERALQRENERIQRQAENEAKLAAKEAERQAKIEAEVAEEQRIAELRVNAVVVNQRIIETVERIKQLEQEIAYLKAAGITEGYADYEDRIAELSDLKQSVKEYRDRLSTVPEKFEKMRRSAKKAFDTVSEGTEKSNASLNGALKTILKYGFGIRSLYTLFNKIRAGIQAGFTNLMGYSDNFANSVQSVKNSMSTLGNQIAGAFRPIVEAVVPWLNSLISAITTAMTYVAQFIALLGGKSTFTKAKKVQDAYNKSLGGTAKAADKARGALAKFDDLDVLEKQEDTSGGGGSGNDTGFNDMFEEVPVDMKLPKWIDGILERLRELKDIFSQGFWDGLGDWEYRWEDIKNSVSSIKDSLIDIWTDSAVLTAANGWVDSVAYMLGSLVGSLASIRLTIATNLVGGIAGYLEQNKDRIKEYLVSMFDIWEEVNYIFSELFQSIAYVFEAFASESGQQLTANIIGIFSDAFMGITELASEIFRDIANIIIQPFVDNKEAFRTALDGFLGVLAEVTGTIKQGIDDTFARLSEVYEEHFKPFFDSIAEGLSDTVGKFMEFWNDNVQPILQEWAQSFDVLWQEHIQPMLNKFVDMLGDVADFLKAVWENVLKPLIDWIIANILPVILSIIDGIVKASMSMAGMIADIVGGIIDVIGGILEFLTGVFTGDWEKAWNGVVKIFDGIWGAIKGIINGILGGVESMANGVINAINAMIRALNSIHFDIPNWVPALGGKSFGFSIGEIPNVTIPKLATGAVIRGGNPFMAILGDQPAGKTNIEAPLATIEQAVENVMSRQGYGRESVPVNINLNYDGETFAQLSISDILAELGRQGYNVDVLGVT